jgi:hypothetical protein
MEGGGKGHEVREDRALGHEYACAWGGGSNDLDSNMIRSWIGGKYHKEKYDIDLEVTKQGVEERGEGKRTNSKPFFIIGGTKQIEIDSVGLRREVGSEVSEQEEGNIPTPVPVRGSQRGKRSSLDALVVRAPMGGVEDEVLRGREWGRGKATDGGGAMSKLIREVGDRREELGVEGQPAIVFGRKGWERE